MDNKVEVYTITVCPYCVSAKQLLQRKGVEFVEHDLSTLSDGELHAKMTELAGRRTVPQVVIGGQPIGGFDQLRQLERTGELDRMLAG